jgi:hypothetical protein
MRPIPLLAAANGVGDPAAHPRGGAPNAGDWERERGELPPPTFPRRPQGLRGFVLYGWQPSAQDHRRTLRFVLVLVIFLFLVAATWPMADVGSICEPSSEPRTRMSKRTRTMRTWPIRVRKLTRLFHCSAPTPPLFPSRQQGSFAPVAVAATIHVTDPVFQPIDRRRRHQHGR